MSENARIEHRSVARRSKYTNTRETDPFSVKCPDTEVEELVRVINGVCDAMREEEMLRSKEEDSCARTLRLERYMSPNFFGLFVEKEKETLLKRLSADLCQVGMKK